MKRSLILLLISIICISALRSQKIGEIPGITEPHSVIVNNNELFFLDGSTVNVFSIKPFSLKYKFGGVGDG